MPKARENYLFVLYKADILFEEKDYDHLTAASTLFSAQGPAALWSYALPLELLDLAAAERFLCWRSVFGLPENALQGHGLPGFQVNQAVGQPGPFHLPPHSPREAGAPARPPAGRPPSEPPGAGARRARKRPAPFPGD